MMAESWMARARGLMVCVKASDEKRRVRADSLKRVIFGLWEAAQRILYAREAGVSQECVGVAAVEVGFVTEYRCGLSQQFERWREARSGNAVAKYPAKRQDQSQRRRTRVSAPHSDLPLSQFAGFGVIRGQLLAGQHFRFTPVGVAPGNHYVKDPLVTFFFRLNQSLSLQRNHVVLHKLDLFPA